MIEGLGKRIHCAGAGGAGMLPLALYLAQNGHQVTAEDDGFSEEAIQMLQQHGVVIGRVNDADEGTLLVYSSAVAESHPAREAARRLRYQTLRRGECLAEIAKQKRLIAVAGSHGKTSTCAMLVDLLDTAGERADYILGAQYEGALPFGAANSDWLIAEIDESDGTIEGFSPEVCVVLNADHDHHARYGSEAEYHGAFARLVARTRSVAIISNRLRSVLTQEPIDKGCEVIWLGEGGDARWEAKPAGPGWSEIAVTGSIHSSFSANRTGCIHAGNAAFALVAAAKAGFRVSAGSRLHFRSVKRRQSSWYCSPEVRVFEDYAHHPRELDAVLEHFAQPRDRRVVVVFQPHRYSRTLALKSEFAASLAAADAVILLEVYAASEAPLPGGRSSDLLSECRARGAVSTCLVSGPPELWDLLDNEVAAGPVDVLFLGAGIGDKLAAAYSQRLADRDARWGRVAREIGRAGGLHTRLAAAEPLANKTTLRVGGPAERYFEPSSIAELGAALKACRASALQVHPLGRGSNLVVPDAGVRGLVIRLGHPYWSAFERLPDGALRVGAGLRIKTLCGQACQVGLPGYEFLEGIPGSVGGALRMNAGAMGAWIFDVVESVRFMTLEGELVEASKAELEVGYRYCRELTEAVAVDAVLRAGNAMEEAASIRRRIDTYQEKRRESQPREPSAGCIFKNPDGASAGKLIDELGLKGTAVGGAEISAVHGNFFVNRGGATSADVIELARLARKLARERRGVLLHPEALLFGSSWEEVL